MDDVIYYKNKISENYFISVDDGETLINPKGGELNSSSIRIDLFKRVPKLSKNKLSNNQLAVLESVKQ